ncbi:hypothetical protein [Novipirellula rosea]|uniref:hypothetical protein n=1 Tax=Novipirellula rosea TaxID=1031540 RepID=UPI0031EFE827
MKKGIGSVDTTGQPIQVAAKSVSQPKSLYGGVTSFANVTQRLVDLPAVSLHPVFNETADLFSRFGVSHGFVKHPTGG